MKRAVFTTFLASAFVAASAHAQHDDWNGETDDPPPKRRSAFSFGASFALTGGNVVAYPNDAERINQPEFRTDTGTALGTNLKLWLGVAMTDYLTFALGFGGTRLAGNDLNARSGDLIFRIETYPLFYEGGVFEDLGLFGDFGGGRMTVKTGGEQVGESGAMSIVGLGVLWEPLRFGRFSAGPFVEYRRMFSRSLTSNAGFAGFRIAFYRGQPKPEPEPPAAEQYPYHPSVAPVRAGPQPGR